jgi:hypothetical protein
MSEPNWDTCTEEELWRFVASHLARNGVDTILVGGAVVAIYTDGLYRSGDLDLVQMGYLSQRIPELMREIGFEIQAGRHYRHPRLRHLIIEFANGPPGIGEDTRIKPATMEAEGTIIRLYSPTDCIRDRLASYIHFQAEDCLDQAVLVATRHPFDRARVKKWCESEGAPEAFTRFEEKLKTD